jgi:hypothetical protein
LDNIELEKNYQIKKDKFHNYINNIKKNSKWDIYTIINPTLIKNPYASEFPKRFFNNDINISSKFILFIKNIIKFYIKNIYLFVSYLIGFILYKIYYKKERNNEIVNIIDVYALVDKINKNKQFDENYFNGLYEIIKKYNTNYTFLLRLYRINKNPFKLIQFFKIINNDKREFVFEYELLNFFDFIKIGIMIFLYPFKVLRLLQKENNNINELFNYSLIYDIKYFSFDSLIRYILGKNLSKINSITNIYSWSEFQVIERSFNYAIRTYCHKINLNALQLFVSYETYFNVIVDDIDEHLKVAPHKVLVNGRYNILKRNKIIYETGVSLRYQDLFLFKGIKEEKNTLLLGSYIETDTKYMIDSVSKLTNVIFKNHPAVNINSFGQLPNTIKVVNNNIYTLFENTKLVIGTASGTALEAVACGISVIIIASQDNLTANPLVEYGKGKIWDIAYHKDDIKVLYNNLLEYRYNSKNEIKQIASWYKDNFFIEPTEENIVKVFELDK